MRVVDVDVNVIAVVGIVAIAPLSGTASHLEATESSCLVQLHSALRSYHHIWVLIDFFDRC